MYRRLSVCVHSSQKAQLKRFLMTRVMKIEKKRRKTFYYI